MKYIFLFGGLLLLFTACRQNDKSADSKKVFGSGNAIVTNQPDSDTAIKGPLAYGPNVPKIQDGDTIDVKFDVRHKLFHISSAVAYTAWWRCCAGSCFKNTCWANGKILYDRPV